jgi:hypothetical protein
MNGEVYFRVQRLEKLNEFDFRTGFYLYGVVIHFSPRAIISLFSGFLQGIKLNADNRIEGVLMKRIIIAVFLCVFTVFSAAATTISFCVFEIGLPSETAKTPAAMQWESALLDVFFDAGYIVTNNPIVRIEMKPTPNRMEEFVRADLDDAREGGADYFVLAQLDFDAETGIPSEISFVMYRVTPSSKIHESRMAGRSFGSNERESLEEMKKVARGLVPHIRGQ